MLKYNIQKGIGANIITVKADDLMRYALYDDTNTPLKWARLGKTQALAIISTPVHVHRKAANTSLVHREYMAHNARGLWLGSSYKDVCPEFDRLLKDLEEYEETINGTL